MPVILFHAVTPFHSRACLIVQSPLLINFNVSGRSAIIVKYFVVYRTPPWSASRLIGSHLSQSPQFCDILEEVAIGLVPRPHCCSSTVSPCVIYREQRIVPVIFLRSVMAFIYLSKLFSFGCLAAAVDSSAAPAAALLPLLPPLLPPLMLLLLPPMLPLPPLLLTLLLPLLTLLLPLMLPAMLPMLYYYVS